MPEIEISNSTVLKLNENILKRFEHNLKGGTMILIDTASEELWLGNLSSKLIIDLIDGKNDIETVYSQILSNYDETDFEQVIEALNAIIEDLHTKGFVEIVKS